MISIQTNCYLHQTPVLGQNIKLEIFPFAWQLYDLQIAHRGQLSQLCLSMQRLYEGEISNSKFEVIYERPPLCSSVLMTVDNICVWVGVTTNHHLFLSEYYILFISKATIKTHKKRIARNLCVSILFGKNFKSVLRFV